MAWQQRQTCAWPITSRAHRRRALASRKTSSPAFQKRETRRIRRSVCVCSLNVWPRGFLTDIHIPGDELLAAPPPYDLYTLRTTMQADEGLRNALQRWPRMIVVFHVLCSERSLLSIIEFRKNTVREAR